MGRVVQRRGYRVKGTFVELRPQSEAERTKHLHAPGVPEAGVVSSQSPGCGEAPHLAGYQPASVGPPPEDTGEQAGAIPVTPSPLMHPMLLPPGSGFMPPFELGFSACGIAGVPGFDEQGVPGLYVPAAMAYEMGCGFYLPQGELGEGFDKLDTDSITDTMTAASIQTELLLEALSDGLSEGRGSEGSHRRHVKAHEFFPAVEPPPWHEQDQGQCPSQGQGCEPAASEPAAGEAEAQAQPPEDGAQHAGACACVEAAEASTPQPPQEEQAKSSSRVAAVPAERARPSRESGRAFGGGGEGRSRHQRRRAEAEAAAHEDHGGYGRTAQEKSISYTTVMLRNIPNKYTRDMLVGQLNLHLRGEFDFVYLPIDFKNGCNVGYGFINFRSIEACRAFVRKFSGVDVCRCLPGINNSNKVAEVTPARVQGLEENVKRLRSSPVMQELVHHPEWMPLVFDTAGAEQPLPPPEGPLPPMRPRGRMKGR